MASNTKLAPFRQYAEEDVINLFAYEGTVPCTAGTVVKSDTSGWLPSLSDNNLTWNMAASNFGNVVSPRWGVNAKCNVAGTGASVLGVLLYDVRETDENSIPLIQNPQKAYENNWTISGQVSPILTKGFVLISGNWGGALGTPAAGDVAYPTGNGEITTSSLRQGTSSVVGKFYGSADLSARTESKGFALLRVDVGP